MLASFDAVCVGCWRSGDSLSGSSYPRWVPVLVPLLPITPVFQCHFQGFDCRKRPRPGLRLGGLRGGVERIHAFWKLKGRWLGYVSERNTALCFSNFQSCHRLSRHCWRRAPLGEHCAGEVTHLGVLFDSSSIRGDSELRS
jgi:hypothetical protein